MTSLSLGNYAPRIFRATDNKVFLENACEGFENSLFNLFLEVNKKQPGSLRFPLLQSCRGKKEVNTSVPQERGTSVHDVLPVNSLIRLLVEK